MSVIITIFMLLTVFPIYFTFLPKMAWHVIYIGVPLLYLLINLDIIQKKLLRIEFLKYYQLFFSIFSTSINSKKVLILPVFLKVFHANFFII